MQSIKGLLMGLSFLFSIAVSSQTIVEVRVVSVYSDVCDLDGFASGDSDNYWAATADDGAGVTADFVHELTANNPGLINLNTTFFSESYVSSPPASIDINWEAFENDGTPGIPIRDAPGSGSVTLNINYGLSAGTWHSTVLETDAVSGFCTGDVNWRMTFQVRHDLPLPVELISFSGQSTHDQEVKLEWEVASELNNHGFEIERSSNGSSYTQIGFVKSQYSNGTGGFAKYQYLDQSASEKNFYRIRQVDFDGSFEYSSAVYVENNQNNEILVFPNPFEDEITLRSLKNENLEILVYDLNGKMVEKIESFKKRIDFGKSLPRGTYYLQINRDAESEYHKVIKR
ncbi:MAG: T9SS type A sorting domain-containing protein [Bacteroidota bacterium]